MPILPRDPNGGKKSAKPRAIPDADMPRPRVRKRPEDFDEGVPAEANPDKPNGPNLGGESAIPDAAPDKLQDPNRNPDGTYKVGKYRTPEHTRWKPGQSGNPRGPKKVKADLSEIVIDTMEQMIALTSAQGRKVRMTQGSALMRKLYEQAVKGNLKAAVFLFDLYTKALDRRSAGGAPDDGLTAAEQEMLQNLFRGFGGDALEDAPA